MTPVRAVVWDMDGTLLDSREAVPAAFVETVRELDGRVLNEQQVVSSYSLGTPEVMLAHLLGRPVSDEQAEIYYQRLERATVRPYPGVREVLERLGRHGPVAIFTGASTRAARILLDGAKLLDHVDVLVGGDDVSFPKPAPDGVREAARRLGRAPRDIAYVGDAPTDLQAARAAHAVAAAAGWGHLHDPDAPADVVLAAPGDAYRLLEHAGPGASEVKRPS